jgi:replicative DNA helicase
MSDIRPQHIQVEEQFINLILNDKDLAKKWVAGNVMIKCFDPAHEHVLRAIAWANGEGVALTRQSFKGFVEQYVKTPAEVAAQMTVFNRIFMKIGKGDDYPMLLSKVKDNYVQRRSAEIMQEYNKERQGNGIIAASQTLTKKLQLLTATFEESRTVYVDLGQSRDKFMEELLHRKANPASRLICHIPEIDDVMSVGFKKGTLSIFCAAPGTFKTTMMMNIALNIFKLSNENVMYIPLEGGVDMFMQKLLSRECRIPSTKIEQAHLLTDDEIKKLGSEFDKWQSLSNRFKILKTGDRARVSIIRHEIETRLAYYQPRVVVVDYLDNVISDSKHSRDDLDIREKLEELIRMGENFDFAVVTAAKLSRDALKRLRDSKEGKQELDSTDIHGGQEFGGNATNIFGQMRNPQQPGSVLDLFSMKARFGSPVFKNGKSKTPLNIKPEIALIESPNAIDENWTDMQAKGAYDLLKQAAPQIDNLPTANDEDEDSPF